jgi:hypothetical protein
MQILSITNERRTGALVEHHHAGVRIGAAELVQGEHDLRRRIRAVHAQLFHVARDVEGNVGVALGLLGAHGAHQAVRIAHGERAQVGAGAVDLETHQAARAAVDVVDERLGEADGGGGP